MKIKVQPMVGGEPLMCSHNVKKRIKACGGSAVYGWEIRDVGQPIETHLSHCVWESPSGEVVCVTPRPKSVEGDYMIGEWPDEIEFERDDAAVFNGMKSLGVRYVPKVKDARVVKACEYASRSETALLSSDLDRCRYWTQRANAQRCGSVWNCPKSLDMKDYLACLETGVA